MNLDGWDIDIESLPGPKRGESPVLYFTDAIFPSPQGTRAAVLYTITEIRMGWDVGLLALFTDRNDPKLVLNPERFLCCYSEDSIIWLSDEMFAARNYCCDAKANKLSVPFALVDLANSRYWFVPLKYSYSHSLSCVGNALALVDRERDERFPPRNSQRYPMEELAWYDLSELAEFDTRYAQHVV